jgi:hypothetical protein
VRVKGECCYIVEISGWLRFSFLKSIQKPFMIEEWNEREKAQGQRHPAQGCVAHYAKTNLEMFGANREGH